MTTTTKMMKAFASILGLGALLIFAGCVKKHGDLAEDVDTTFSIQDVVGVNIEDDEGNKVRPLSAGTYFVQDDYVGCDDTALPLGSLAADDKVVVSLSNGKTAACVKPAALAKMKEKPKVTYYKAPGVTEYFIQTREVVRTSGRTESPTGVKVQGDIGIRMLDIVDYTTNSPILAEVRDRINLRALPGEKYKVFHKITPKVLYVMKVATKDKLSHLDLQIADNMGNGEYAVPIAAVEIILSQYRNNRNADREKTNRYRFQPVDTLNKATHISFNFNDVKEIDLPVEASKDVYPADYFTTGQWYISESVVDTRPGSEGLIGTSTGAFDKDFREASKVQFKRTDTALIACNVGVDERFADDKDCSKHAQTLSIPTTSHSYKLESTSSEVTEERILSTAAPFIKVDFKAHSTIRKTLEQNIFLEDLGRIVNGDADQLLGISFSENKFSFLIERGSNGRRVRYSLLRAGNRDYETRRHYKDDRQNKFGYFVQPVAKIRSTDTIAREEDLEKDYLVQRHNPKKDIKFYFSRLTPDYAKSKDPYGLEIDYREIGRKSIEYWNNAYKRAGAPNKVVLIEAGSDLLPEEDSEFPGAPYGDISYNTINLIDSERGSNLLGVGPSLVDPFSGEVINANANVYIAPFREIIANQVRNYIKAKTGVLDEPAKSLPRGATENSTLLGDMNDSVVGIKDTIAMIVPENIISMVANFYHHGVSAFTSDKVFVDQFASNTDAVVDLYSLSKFNSENSMVQALSRAAAQVPELRYLRDEGKITFSPRSRKDLLKLQQALEAHRPTFYRSYFMSDSALASDYNTMTGQIEEQCGEVLKLVSFVNNRAEGEGAPARLTTDEELPALRHCMTQIIPDKFQATLIHEIGHTLGLRHNFYASADKANFFNKEEVKELYNIELQDHELPRSSSVMDYVRTEQDRLTYPGHYDIAAIRYGYANAVEVESNAKRPNSLTGNYVELKQSRDDDMLDSIKNILASKGLEAKPFAYCTDVEASLEIDPMCARHDFGTNPKMIVEDTINSFWESFTLYNFKYDRIRAGVTGPFARAARMDKLKRIYTEWRVHLANYLGKTDSTGNVYLQRYTPEQYDALLTELKADPNFKGKDYLAVRDQIFDFVLDVAFFPNKYCLLNTPVGLKAYEFDRLRDELKNQVPTGTKISSCEAPEMQDLITSKGYEYLFEAGLPVDNLWYSVNPQDTFEEDVNFRSFRAPLDVVGSFLDRYFASTFLGGRSAGYTGLLEKMFPNMMDEPDLYLKFEQRMVERMTKGADLRDVFSRANNITIPEDVNLTLPNYAAESALLKALWLSLEQGIRNQFANTSNKLAKYTRSISNDGDQIRDAQENGGFVMPLTDGSSLIVRREATVAFSLVEAMIGVQQAFQGAGQPVPTAEQLVASLQPVMPQLAALLSQTEVEVTAEQYLEFSRAFMGLFAQTDAFQQALLQQIFIPDLAIYLVELRGADDAIRQAQAAGQEPPAGAVEYLNGKINEYNTVGMTATAQRIKEQLAANGQNIDVVVPTAVSVPAKYAAQATSLATPIAEQAKAEQEQRQAYLTLHGDELSEQYDLLRSVLIYDFSAVQQDFNIRIAEITGDIGVDNYRVLMNNSRSDIREFAQKYLNPKLIAEKELGVEFVFDSIPISRKF